MACSPTSTPDKSERELADAVNHLVCGKRHLLVNDYVAAVASLQEACQIFSKRYGETGNECAEPYLYYGKALLEFSRMETGVLGNALQGVTPEDEDSEDEEEGEDEDEDEQVENPDKIKDGSGTGEESESTGEKSQDDAASLGEESGPSTSGGKPKEDGEDEVTNLQLAWEVLELSKVIFKRQAETDKTKELKVAEVLLKLGEVSIESENYGQAVEDLTECLTIQRRNLESHDRALAETLYQLGLATSFNNQFEVAIENFTHSMKVIEDRINFLKQCEEDRQKNSINATVPKNKDKTQGDAKESKEIDVKQNENSDSNKNGENANDEPSEDNSKPSEETKDSKEAAEIKKERKLDDGDKSEESMDTSGNDKVNEGASSENSEDKKVKDEKNSLEKSGITKNSTSKDINDDDDPWQDTKREIEELEGLIPDIKTKIEDTEDMMKNAIQSIKEAALQRLTESPGEQVSIKSEEKVSAKPISNVSHLVKRKRKPEDESSSAETNDVKKPRPSEELEEKHVNGTTVLNGDSKPMETDESSKVKVVSMETQPEAEQSVA